MSKPYRPITDEEIDYVADVLTTEARKNGFQFVLAIDDGKTVKTRLINMTEDGVIRILDPAGRPDVDKRAYAVLKANQARITGRKTGFDPVVEGTKPMFGRVDRKGGIPGARRYTRGTGIGLSGEDHEIDLEWAEMADPALNNHRHRFVQEDAT